MQFSYIFLATLLVCVWASAETEGDKKTKIELISEIPDEPTLDQPLDDLDPQTDFNADELTPLTRHRKSPHLDQVGHATIWSLSSVFV